MTKVINQTHFIYGSVNQDGCSAEMFENIEEAKKACIESMKRIKKGGWSVANQAIIRVDRIKTYNETFVICEQVTKTVVEIIDKDTI